MNLRIPIVVVLLCIIGISANHFVIDWGNVTSEKVSVFFDDLVQEQKRDLIAWSEEGAVIGKFQKRTYCDGTLEKWSDNRTWIQSNSDKSLVVLEDETGMYLFQRIKKDDCFYTSIYPLFRNYSITNRYLRSRKNILLPKDLADISLGTSEFQYRDLFQYTVEETPSRAIDTLLMLCLVLCLIIVFWKGMDRNWPATIVTLIAVRALTLYFGVLEGFIRYPLFDSLYYTSSVWNPTLGDLFVNCLLIFIVTLHWSRRFRKEEWLKGSSLYIIAAIALGFSLCVFSVLWSILDNSQIAMDAGKSMEFGLMRAVAHLCILLVTGCQFLVSFRLVGFVREAQPSWAFYFFLIVMTGLVYLFTLLGGLATTISVLVIVITIRLDWGNRLKEFKYENLQFVLILSMSISSVLAFTVYKHHEKSELDAKRKFANHLLIKRDVLGEYYLNQVMTEIRESADVLGSREELEEAVNLQLLNPYFDKYKIVVTDSLRDPCIYLEQLTKMTYKNLSDYQDIYFLDEGTEFKYLGKLDGVLISLALKRRVPTTVFPALLTDSKYFTPSDDFDYAVFSEGKILFQRSKFGQGEWPENKDFQNEKLFDDGIERNGRHYYGVQTVDGRVILIISKKYGRRLQVTDFSFYFLLVLFFLGSIVLLSSLNLKEAKLNFTGKIQLYLGLAFVIPLFTAGFALLNSLNVSYKEEINRSYLKKALYISELLAEEVGGAPKDITSLKLAQIRDFTQSDISFYDRKGFLKATSQQEIFDLNLQSKQVNPMVFSELVAKENQSMIAEESIGGLSYKVSYATLNNSSDSVVGFIAMPFFDSRNHLKRQQLEVFGNLISIFGFIFIIATLFGNMVLNNLMNPLRMVADKIRQITLQQENKPIEYKSSDEIGSLVKDYNSMLVKLEQSKAALAKSQKETAWKEIAKQVAHEIKNPLTPMQLKIQQLLRKHEEGSKEYEALSGLLTQVHTMSQIASSFSDFAEMPVPNNTVFNFSKLVSRVVDLYHSEEVKIQKNLDEAIRINADKDIFKRILNNIVLNAIQSVEETAAHIRVELVEKRGKCELSISDNGKGISDELRDKIFLNYFSTKSSGSGIGLALAKKGIENAGGNIWFESKVGEGTTFFISMPLVTT